MTAIYSVQILDPYISNDNPDFLIINQASSNQKAIITTASSFSQSLLHVVTQKKVALLPMEFFMYFSFWKSCRSLLRGTKQLFEVQGRKFILIQITGLQDNANTFNTKFSKVQYGIKFLSRAKILLRNQVTVHIVNSIDFVCCPY